jgi:hypothetical protein
MSVTITNQTGNVEMKIHHTYYVYVCDYKI